MDGGSDQLKIQTAPLMSDLQRKFLDNYISGIANTMQGFQFGQPYPGATSSGYNPMKFVLGQKYPTYTNPFGPSLGAGEKGEQTGPDEDVGGRPPGREPPGRELPGGVGKASISSLPFILNSIGQPNQPVSNENQLMKLLTSPYLSPFRYPMTGNYPGRQ